MSDEMGEKDNSAGTATLAGPDGEPDAVILDGSDLCADLIAQATATTPAAGGVRKPAQREPEEGLPEPAASCEPTIPPESLETNEPGVPVPEPSPEPLLELPPMPPPRTVATFTKAWQLLVEAVADELDGRERLWVLQAGPGKRPLFDLPEDAFLVGVGRDARALEVNIRLDERVVADLADYQPWATGFDMVTCWYELNRLSDPTPVLDRFAAWTAENGLVVLATPNPRSLHGFWLRFTGRAPLRGALSGRSLRRRFGRAGFTPLLHVYFESVEHAQSRRRMRVTGRWWQTIQALTRIFSLGLLDAARTDHIVVFRRDE